MGFRRNFYTCPKRSYDYGRIRNRNDQFDQAIPDIIAKVAGARSPASWPATSWSTGWRNGVPWSTDDGRIFRLVERLARAIHRGIARRQSPGKERRDSRNSWPERRGQDDADQDPVHPRDS